MIDAAVFLCDLTGNMASFAKTFRSLGRDLKLYVDYTKTPP